MSTIPVEITPPSEPIGVDAGEVAAMEAPAKEGPPKGGAPRLNTSRMTSGRKADPAKQRVRLQLGTLPDELSNIEREGYKLRGDLERTIQARDGRIDDHHQAWIFRAANLWRLCALAIFDYRTQFEKLTAEQRAANRVEQDRLSMAYTKALAALQLDGGHVASLWDSLHDDDGQSDIGNDDAPGEALANVAADPGGEPLDVLSHPST